VGLVLPGFIATEGFPQRELRDRALTRRLVSTPERGAEAIADVALRRRAERYVPRPYVLAAAARVLLPGAVRRFSTSTKAGVLTPRTRADDPDQA
jgi:short-subunit dehydrogenase